VFSFRTQIVEIEVKIEFTWGITVGRNCCLSYCSIENPSWELSKSSCPTIPPEL